MKKIITITVTLLLFILSKANAQVPQKMSFQIVVRDSVGALITNANVSFKISILKDSTNGTITYTETQNITTNNNGLASLEIGAGIALTGSFATISWGSSSHFIKTEIDPLGGTNYSISGVSQLLSVPYALYAENTKKGSLPTVATNSAIAPTNSNTTATITCDLSNTGGEFVIARGVCYATTNNPTLNNAYETFPVGTSSSSSTGTYTITASNLTSNTTYYVKGFATTINGTAYGNEVSFTTNQFVTPTLDNLTTSLITRTSISASADVTNDGGATVTQRGFCYSSTNGSPTIADSKIFVGAGIGNFTGLINALTAGTNYSLRAFATNNIGTAYGNQIVTFTTLPLIKPTITTLDTLNLTATTVNLGGKITDNGGTAIIEKGICYSKTPNATIANYKVVASGNDSFRLQLDTLSYNTTYYARAYAINSVGVSYGNEISFKTDTLKIGSKYQGGVVGYILRPADPGYDINLKHGLIISPNDVIYSPEIPWGCADTLLSGANGTALGTGMQNTIDIVTSCFSPNTAAKRCNDLLLNGYSDWYLPSYDELYKIYLNRNLNGMNYGTLSSNCYWSSSQANQWQALQVCFPNGMQDIVHKSADYQIIPVRSF